MITPYYLTPPALALIGRIRSNPPQCYRHFHGYVQTRDEWTAYSGDTVDALDLLHSEAFAALEAAGADRDTIHAHLAASPQKVINAALGVYPRPLTRDVMDEIDLIAANIAAAEMAQVLDAQAQRVAA